MGYWPITPSDDNYSEDVFTLQREVPTVSCVNCGAVFKPYEGRGFGGDDEYITDEFCPACGAPYEIRYEEDPDDDWS